MRVAEDGVLHIVFTKGSKGVTWKAMIRGHTQVDDYTASEVQKSLMLERFQAEVRASRCYTAAACAPCEACGPCSRGLCLSPCRTRGWTFRARHSTGPCQIRRRSWGALATTQISQGVPPSARHLRQASQYM